MQRWYITGTDTDVGKSVVTACLAQAWRVHGAVWALKPIASGVPLGTTSEDAQLLGEAAGHPPLCYDAFIAPLSPHRAARLEGRHLDRPSIRDWCSQYQANQVLIEGVGGWRVPFGGWNLSDLVRELPGSVILVTSNRLGVLHHTLQTLETITNDGCTPIAVVLNAAALDDASTMYNFEDLRELVSIPIFQFPRINPYSAEQRAAAGAVMRVALTGG